MNRAATVALAPFGGLYSLLVRTNNAFYRRGILKISNVGAPVISVGNLTSGGTGKTPLVEWIARELAGRGRKVCILTRGYRRENSNQRVIASDGKDMLAGVKQTGDEAFLLGENLRGKAAVICDSDRVSAAGWAIKNFGSDVLVLDDGFQHRRIARQLDILTIDAMNPWGNGRLLPGGILREPISELSRADCVVITRADLSDTEDIRRQVERIRPGMLVLLSHTKHTQLREFDPTDTNPDFDQVRSSPVSAFCAIGNPESFFSLLSREGYNVVHTKTFRDHHSYTAGDIDQLVREAQRSGAQALLTTAKDAVKLRSLSFVLPCYAVEIATEIEREDLLRELISRAIEQAGTDD
jgi:tetraacyldisaccharide 4'-kinase